MKRRAEKATTVGFIFSAVFSSITSQISKISEIIPFLKRPICSVFRVRLREVPFFSLSSPFAGVVKK